MYWSNTSVHDAVADQALAQFSEGIGIDRAQIRIPKQVPPELLQPFHGPPLEAGLSDYWKDFGKIDFDDLIRGANEIDICNVYGQTWYRQNSQYLVDAFSNPNLSCRICMLSSESPALEGFAYQFGRQSVDELKSRIDAASSSIREAISNAKQRRGTEPIAHVRVYRCNNIINHSFYRFDDLLYFAPRKLASPRLSTRSVPSITFRRVNRENDLFGWLMEDFETLLITDGDVELSLDTRRD
jgi:hypothetical protein